MIQNFCRIICSKTEWRGEMRRKRKRKQECLGIGRYSSGQNISFKKTRKKANRWKPAGENDCYFHEKRIQQIVVYFYHRPLLSNRIVYTCFRDGILFREQGVFLKEEKERRRLELEQGFAYASYKLAKEKNESKVSIVVKMADLWRSFSLTNRTPPLHKLQTPAPTISSD